MEDTVALLARVPAFETLGPEELARVAEVAVPRAYGTIVLAAFAVLVILAAAGVLLFYPR